MTQPDTRSPHDPRHAADASAGEAPKAGSPYAVSSNAGTPAADSAMASCPAPAAATASYLPDVPDGLMVFDGHCNFCAAQVRLLLRLDRRGVIRYTPFQSDYGRQLGARLGIDPDNAYTFVFFDHGRALRASDGVIAIFRRLPAPWRWLWLLALVPKPLRDALYYWVGRNRYRLLGRRDTVIAPTPAQRGRFIEAPPGG